MKIYTIENNGNLSSQDSMYRFKSLIQNTIGAWCYTKEDAIKQGEKHQRLMSEIHQIKFEDIKDIESDVSKVIPTFVYNDNMLADWYICSHCGKDTSVKIANIMNDYKYCPTCGKEIDWRRATK